MLEDPQVQLFLFKFKITSCVVNNGYSSPFFKVTRGIRQGCPLSAYLFLLVAETLGTGIRQNSNIQGIKIGINELCTIQMADDATLFLEVPYHFKDVYYFSEISVQFQA